MKKLFSICLAMLFIVEILIASPGSSASAAENNYYTEDVGRLIAEAFLNQHGSSYPPNCLTELDEIMYDFGGTPSAYKYNVKTIDYHYAGYIIVGAQNQFAPVIEFSTGGEQFTWRERLAAINSDLSYEKTYYTGGIEYIIQGSDNSENTFYINADTMVTSVSSPPSVYSTSSQISTFASAWESIDAALLIEQLNDFITTNPVSSLFAVTTEGYVIPGSTEVDYFLMTDFSGYNNHCGATAAINCFRFMSQVLDFNFGDNWNNIFRELYTLSKTDPSWGAYTSDVTDAMRQFWHNYGYNSDTQWYSIRRESDVRDPIKRGTGCVILVNDHPTYGNHFVFGMGYDYQSIGGNSVMYAVVADGWYHGTRHISYDSTWISVIDSSPFLTFSLQ